MGICCVQHSQQTVDFIHQLCVQSQNHRSQLATQDSLNSKKSLNQSKAKQAHNQDQKQQVEKDKMNKSSQSQVKRHKDIIRCTQRSQNWTKQPKPPSVNNLSPQNECKMQKPLLQPSTPVQNSSKPKYSPKLHQSQDQNQFLRFHTLQSCQLQNCMQTQRPQKRLLQKSQPQKISNPKPHRVNFNIQNSTLSHSLVLTQKTFKPQLKDSAWQPQIRGDISKSFHFGVGTRAESGESFNGQLKGGLGRSLKGMF